MTSLAEVLSSFENRTDAFTEFEISDALDTVENKFKERGESLPLDVLSECIAFDLWPDYRSEERSWTSYYGPLSVTPVGGGQSREWPSMSHITKEVIEYWENRAQNTKHPLLRNRYSDLVWDFKFLATSEKPNVKFAWATVDSALAVINGKQFKDFYEAERLLKRALAITVPMKDKVRIPQVVTAIIELPALITHPTEKEQANVFAYDTLIDNRGLGLTDDQIAGLIQVVENLLLRAAGGSDGLGQRDHFEAEVLAVRLADHYRKQELKDDVSRVLKMYGDALKAAVANTSAIVACSQLQRLYDIYNDFGVNDAASQTLVDLQERTEGINQELQRASFSTTIPADRMEAVVSEMISGDLPEVLARLAILSVTDINEAKGFVELMSKESITLNIFSQRLLGHDGRVVAEVGTVKEDADGHAILQLSRNMQFEGQLLRPIIERAIEKFNLRSKGVIEFVELSPLYSIGRRELLRVGLDAYFEKNWITSIHLLLPQVENALRQLLRLCGRPVMKPSRSGVFVLKNEDDILRDVQVVKCLGKRGSIRD